MTDPYMLFDLQFKDADIQQALGDFFRQAGRAFVLDDDLDSKISLHVADVGFQDALELMLPTGYTAAEIDGVYHIRRMPKAA